jgi:hypothetical protein
MCTSYIKNLDIQNNLKVNIVHKIISFSEKHKRIQFSESINSEEQKVWLPWLLYVLMI